MITTTPLLITSKGGSITCFRGQAGRIFRSCSRTRCIYSRDLHSAKLYLDKLEYENKLISGKNIKHPSQRKTTLKWTSDGELTAIDMARILDRLANPKLTMCDLACDLKDHSPKQRMDPLSATLPISSWIP